MMQVPPPLDSDTSEQPRYRVVQAPAPLPGEEGFLDLPDEGDFQGLLDPNPDHRYLMNTYPSLFRPSSSQPGLPGAGTPTLAEGPREPTGVGVGGGPRPYVAHKSPRRVAPTPSPATVQSVVLLHFAPRNRGRRRGFQSSRIETGLTNVTGSRKSTPGGS